MGDKNCCHTSFSGSFKTSDDTISGRHHERNSIEFTLTNPTHDLNVFVLLWGYVVKQLDACGRRKCLNLSVFRSIQNKKSHGTTSTAIQNLTAVCYKLKFVGVCKIYNTTKKCTKICSNYFDQSLFSENVTSLEFLSKCSLNSLKFVKITFKIIKRNRMKRLLQFL